VIIPCRNERAFIRGCLESVTGGDFPEDRLEVLVVDGMSDDGTREEVEKFAAAHRSVSLHDNPRRIAPTALNVGIRQARGAIIVRTDAHSRYPRNYIASLVEWLEKSGADNVGGVWITRPANDSAKARAIAAGLSSPFGVGNAHFRIGVREPKWVDTVPFGCYRREVFDRIGLFDEELVRNQDDEFNARLIRRGGRILLVPDIVSEYFARESLGKLWRTYFQYGYFKPLAARKVGAVLTGRQLVPALFVALLIAGGALAWFVPIAAASIASVLAVYAAADLLFAVRSGVSSGWSTVLWLTLVFPVLHVSYGLGYLKGVLDFVIRHRSPQAAVRATVPSR